MGGNDTIYGNTGYDVLYGGDGNDALYGGDEGDQLLGDSGDDTIYGGYGYDDLDGGDGQDQLFGENEGDSLRGGAGKDTLSGGYGADTLLGGDDADVLSGDHDADTLLGGAGDDIVAGGYGVDELDGGVGNDTLRGGDDTDTLTGGIGIDYLFGDYGTDTLDGGPSGDFLDGGDANDTCVNEDSPSAMTSCELLRASTDANIATDVLAALVAVSDVSSGPSDVLEGVSKAPTDITQQVAIESVINDVAVTVPSDPNQPITLDPSTGADVSIGLPFRNQADSAQSVTTGIVSYDNNNGSSTAPIVKDDGSLQLTTVIDNANSPQRYDYQISFPTGGQLQLDESGTVLALDSQGEMVAAVAPAWAKDSNGTTVPTHYEVSGNTLTQVIDLSSAAITYPVVADPYLGLDLLQGVWKNRAGGYSYKNGVQYSTKLSNFGLTIWSGAGQGNLIVQSHGWTEFVARGSKKYGSGVSTTTVYQQYRCHATFGYAVWLSGLWWDFETARGVRNNWLTSPQNCNWA